MRQSLGVRRARSECDSFVSLVPAYGLTGLKSAFSPPMAGRHLRDREAPAMKDAMGAFALDAVLQPDTLSS
jgi:hypothetical protein